MANGVPVWAPQYTLHKTLMGLWDMFAYTGSQESLDVLCHFADWFHKWTGRFSAEEMSRILDVETGGMLEIWADLYGLTAKQEYRELMERYWRPSLFDRLLKGEDALTNEHANTTIPEVLGAARAWEVTGDQRWRDVVEAYWCQAVTKRGCFCTGGQTMGEIWTAPHLQSARLGEKNQEHCVVYNMMRLADKLLQWTGDPVYADYWEQNHWNGILAQQHPQTGMVTYFLPLHAGSHKKWGSPTEDFWCCHGSLIQAHAAHGNRAFYQTRGGVALMQYQASELTFTHNGMVIRLRQETDAQESCMERPRSHVTNIRAEADTCVNFDLTLRIPFWAGHDSQILINGQPHTESPKPGTLVKLDAFQTTDRVEVILTRRLIGWPLTDEPDTVAFLDGPVVLAGLCSEERVLPGDPSHLKDLLVPDSEREWKTWQPGWRTKGVDHGFRLIPLYKITDEAYQVYFSLNKGPSSRHEANA